MKVSEKHNGTTAVIQSFPVMKYARFLLICWAAFAAIEVHAKGQGNSISGCSVAASGNGEVVVTVNAGAAIKSFFAYGSPTLSSGQAPACSGYRSCTVGNLVPGQVYDFFVSGTNNGGNQGSSGVSCGSAKGGGSAPPKAPTGVTGNPGNQQLVVSWTPPPGAINGYQICISSTPSNSCQSGCIPVQGSCAGTVGPVSSCTATGLSNGANYYVSLAANNGGGLGACSQPSGPFAPSSGIPDAPVITGIVPGDGQLNVQWNKPNIHGQPIIGYVMQIAGGRSGPWSEAPAACASAQINLSDPLNCVASSLTNGQVYFFRVAAVISGNLQSPWSNVYQGIPLGSRPIGFEDQYLMSQGDVLDTAKATGANQTSVLNNDKNASQAVLIYGPAHAKNFSFNSGGGFIYEPDPSFVGDDVFTYAAGVGNQNTLPIKVTIHVSATNLPPVANSDVYSVNLNQTLSIPSLGVMLNDSDPEHHSIAARLLSLPASGTLFFAASGAFKYVPNYGFTGTDQFTYEVSDGQLKSQPATVTIQVNKVDRAPIANPLGYSTAQDVALNIQGPGVLINDLDPDRDTLSANLAQTTVHGSLTLAANGSFNYIPNPGFSGVDNFTYVASDGTLSSSPATVTITVNAVSTNKPPIGVPDLFYVAQGQTLSVTRAGGVLANDVDPENHPLTRTIASQSIHGSFNPVDAGGFTYIPNPSFNGVDTFTYMLSDGQLTVGPITAKLIVLPINRKPQANPDAWSLSQDSQIYVNPLNGVLVNDVDPQGASLKAILLTQPTQGLLNPIDGGGFGYIPHPGFSGRDSFTYKVTNGVLESDPTTVYLNVNPLPSVGSVVPPIANPDSWVVEMNQVLDVPDRGLLINDLPPQGIPIFATPFTQPSHGTLAMVGGGGFTYTPEAGFSGQDFFYYTAIGGGLSSSPALVKITVTPTASVPKPPNPTKIKLPGGTKVVIPPPSQQKPVTGGGKPLPPKPSEGPGKIVVVSPPSNGSVTVTPDGGYVYAPNPGFGGTDTFTIATSNSGNVSQPSPVLVEVSSPDNDRPPEAFPRTYRGLPGSPVIYSNAKGLLQSARDPDGDFLRAIVVTYPKHGYIDLQKNGEFAYYPDPGFTGTDTFSWKANDGLLDSNVVTDQLICNRCSRRE